MDQQTLHRTCLRLAFAAGTLTMEGLPPAHLRRLFGSLPWIWDARSQSFRCDALHYASVRQRLASSRPDCDDQVCRWPAVHWPRVVLPQLRPEQSAAVSAWSKSRRGIVVMPTGTGKTEVALAIMHEVAVATLVVAPVRDLMYQWHRRILGGLGYDAGIIGDNRFRVAPVSVTTYDSACIHMERLGNRFGLVIFDECHHLPGPVRGDAARMCAAPQRLGLTATPPRADGRAEELCRLIGPIAYELPIAQGRGRMLADYQVVRIPVHLSDEEQYRYERLAQRARAGFLQQRQDDPHATWQDLCRAAASDPRARRAMQAFRAKQAIEDRAEEKLRVLEDLFRLHAGEPCLIFTGSNWMAREVSKRFLIPCLLSHCRKHERARFCKALRQAFIQHWSLIACWTKASTCRPSRWPSSSAARPPHGKPSSGSDAFCAKQAIGKPLCTKWSAAKPMRLSVRGVGGAAKPMPARGVIVQAAVNSNGHVDAARMRWCQSADRKSRSCRRSL